ncbi:MAG: glycosyltransferase family 39 protein [Bacteroidales bacterium]
MKPAQNKNAIKKSALINPKKENSFSVYLIIAFCFPVLLYLQTVNYGFTYFDDNGIIAENINFLKHFSNAFHAFLINTSAFYRPMQTVSYMIDIQLSGAKSTWMFHLSNVLLLGLIATSLFILLRRLSIPPKLALTGALIYSVHPLFVSAIAWIPARGDMQLTLFSLLAFIFFIDFLQKGKLKYMFLNWAAFTIALFCKETAAFLPFLFIIYLFTIHKGKRFEKKYLYNALLYGVSGIIWFWMRTKAIGDFSDHDAVFGLTAFLASLRVIPESLAKFFLPFFNEPNPGFSVFKTLAGIVIIVLIVIVFFKNKQRLKKELLFCLCCLSR